MSFYVLFSGIPVEEINRSNHVTLVMTNCGGHVAFVDSLFARGRSFMDRLVNEYLQTVTSNLDELQSMREHGIVDN